jgi:hypothetical protein
MSSAWYPALIAEQFDVEVQLPVTYWPLQSEKLGVVWPGVGSREADTHEAYSMRELIVS